MLKPTEPGEEKIHAAIEDIVLDSKGETFKTLIPQRVGWST